MKNFETNSDILFKNSLIQNLGLVTGNVLCELLAEHFHAFMNNLNIGPHFLVNLQRLSVMLNITETEVHQALKNLLELNLIYFCPCGISNTFMMSFYEDTITEFTDNCERKYKPYKWDFNLSETQNPTVQDTSFNKATYKLIQLVNDNMKKPQHIPMITYAYCNTIFEGCKINEKSFFEDKTIQNHISKCVNGENFELINLPSLIYVLCSKIKKK